MHTPIRVILSQPAAHPGLALETPSLAEGSGPNLPLVIFPRPAPGAFSEKNYGY